MTPQNFFGHQTIQVLIYINLQIPNINSAILSLKKYNGNALFQVPFISHLILIMYNTFATARCTVHFLILSACFWNTYLHSLFR